MSREDEERLNYQKLQNARLEFLEKKHDIEHKKIVLKHLPKQQFYESTKTFILCFGALTSFVFAIVELGLVPKLIALIG